VSLRHLIDFSGKNKQLIDQMSKDENEFLFAISSINVTYFLMTYYHLPDTLSYEKDKERIASRSALKSFCSMLEKRETTLVQIHNMLITDLFNVWMQLKKTIAGLNLLYFHMPKDIVFEKFVAVTKSQYFDNFDQLKQRYTARQVQLPRQKSDISTSKLK